MRHGWTLKIALLIGLLAGLALLTKSSGLALLPALGVAWLVSGRRSEKPLATGLATLAVPLLVAAPWLMRNTSLYGDPLGLRIFKEAFVGSAQASMFTGTVGPIAYWSDWVLWWTSRSFIGAFGYMDIFLANPLYLAALAIVGVLVLGQLVGRSRESKPLVPGASLFLTAFFFVIVALFVQFNLTYFQGQARYLFPAIAPIAVALGAGAVNLSQRRPALGWALPLAALVCLNVYVLTTVLPEAFAIRATG
jgi:4-amino-4-deoxy-L-arabinose transferase-like glycosyltransferase